MRAKTFLLQVRKLDKLIENKLAEQAQWQAVATSTTGSYGSDTGVRVQSSGNQQKMESAIVRYMEMDAEADREIARLIDIKRDVISVIEMLDSVQYDILHKMYIGVIVEYDQRHPRIEYKTLPDIADIYGKSYSWAKEKHGKALKNVQRILDAREK